MTGPICLMVQSGVAELTLQRPEIANVVDLPTAVALRDAIEQVAADDSVGAVLLRGAGPRFCAGGDVSSMVDAADQGAYLTELATALDAALVLLGEVQKPVVAAVQGAVAGAGLAVMLSCDLVLAERSTKFVTAYAGVGLTPDCGLSYLLPRAVGQQRALELLLTPRVLLASEALDWGLVTEVVDDGAAFDRAAEIAGRLAAGPAYALGQARSLVRAAWSSSRSEVGTREAAVIGRAVIRPAAQSLLSRFAR